MSKLGYEDDQETQVEEQNDDGENVETNEPVVNVVEDDAPEDQRLNEEQQDDEDDGDSHQQRKRETAKERRARARAAKERDKQELEILRATVNKQSERQSQLEREIVVTRFNDLEGKYQQALAEAQTYDTIYDKAMIAKNPDDAAQARAYANEARNRASQLKTGRDQLETVLKQPARQQQQEAPYAAQARAFLADMPWYNPASGDEDSLIVQALDTAQMKVMNPNSPEYWKRLAQKVRERLPHRFDDDHQEESDDGDQDDSPPPRQQARTEQRRKGPPTGGSSRSTSGRGGPSEIRLPREMVEAMKEAGHWDDPKQRERVARRYIESVKNNR